jgi:hypothetical protein
MFSLLRNHIQTGYQILSVRAISFIVVETFQFPLVCLGFKDTDQSLRILFISFISHQGAGMRHLDRDIQGTTVV